MIVLHSTGHKTHISGLSSFLTSVVKNARKVFITSHHADLFAFTQNQQKKRIRQSEQSCPQTSPPGFKCEIHKAENVRRGTSRDCLLARRSGNPALCEVKGRGHLVCAFQRTDGSGLLSNVSQVRLAILQRERGAYILALQLFMYLPWFLTGFHHIPKPPTCPPKPDGTRRSNHKRRKLLRVS